MVQESYLALNVEIDNIKEDIKEIKTDSKETNKYFREVIDTLKENSIRQTEILDNQVNQQKAQFAQVNNEIAELNGKIDNGLQSHTKWYQDFLSNNFGMVFKLLIVLILLLAGVKLAGIDIGELLKLKN